MDLGDALAWLDSHQNLERMLADQRPTRPDLSRMRTMCDIMGDPQLAVPVIHVTGTNGKTSTARALTQILMAKGLSVGTFTSPHLERINERLTFDGVPIEDDEMAELLSSVAGLESVLGDGARLSWFEILAAAAFRWFADRPVDVAVVEVGMGGRWDATNVANGAVSVITNVGLDHLEFLGPTLTDVAREKAGIVRTDGTLVLGETSPELFEVFAAERPAVLWWRERDFGCPTNELAVGGRRLTLRTPAATYDEVFLALHGPYQAQNFVGALAAAEAFFGAPIGDELVRQAAGTVRSPGRLEVVSRRPLVVLDGAKNLDGARALASAINEEFGLGRRRILVVGMLRGKDPRAMLAALGAERAALVIACVPPSPRAHSAEDVAAAAISLGVAVEVGGPVDEAVAMALRAASGDDLVLVTGSLYVVGAARSVFSH